MASNSWSSVHFESASFSSSYGASLVRSSSRAPMPIAFASSRSFFFGGGVSRYRTISGSTPLSRINVSTLREVLQLGL